MPSSLPTAGTAEFTKQVYPGSADSLCKTRLVVVVKIMTRTWITPSRSCTGRYYLGFSWITPSRFGDSRHFRNREWRPRESLALRGWSKDAVRPAV